MKKGSKIIILGSSMYNGLEKNADAVAKIMYRKICYSRKHHENDYPSGRNLWLANSCYLDFSWHAVMTKMMLPLLPGEHVMCLADRLTSRSYK